MQTVIAEPTPEQIEEAWSKARSSPDTPAAKCRYNEHGARIDRDKLGNTEDSCGWLVAMNEAGGIHAINQFFRLPPETRATINTLRNL
jgi:hypothetical protein